MSDRVYIGASGRPVAVPPRYATPISHRRQKAPRASATPKTNNFAKDEITTKELGLLQALIPDHPLAAKSRRFHRQMETILQEKRVQERKRPVLQSVSATANKASDVTVKKPLITSESRPPQADQTSKKSKHHSGKQDAEIGDLATPPTSSPAAAKVLQPAVVGTGGPAPQDTSEATTRPRPDVAQEIATASTGQAALLASDVQAAQRMVKFMPGKTDAELSTWSLLRLRAEWANMSRDRRAQVRLYRKDRAVIWPQRLRASDDIIRRALLCARRNDKIKDLSRRFPYAFGMDCGTRRGVAFDEYKHLWPELELKIRRTANSLINSNLTESAASTSRSAQTAAQSHPPTNLTSSEVVNSDADVHSPARPLSQAQSATPTRTRSSSPTRPVSTRTREAKYMASLVPSIEHDTKDMGAFESSNLAKASTKSKLSTKPCVSGKSAAQSTSLARQTALTNPDPANSGAIALVSSTFAEEESSSPSPQLGVMGSSALHRAATAPPHPESGRLHLEHTRDTSMQSISFRFRPATRHKSLSTRRREKSKQRHDKETNDMVDDALEWLSQDTKPVDKCQQKQQVQIIDISSSDEGHEDVFVKVQNRRHDQEDGVANVRRDLPPDGFREQTAEGHTPAQASSHSSRKTAFSCEQSKKSTLPSHVPEQLDQSSLELDLRQTSSYADRLKLLVKSSKLRREARRQCYTKVPALSKRLASRLRFERRNLFAERTKLLQDIRRVSDEATRARLKALLLLYDDALYAMITELSFAEDSLISKVTSSHAVSTERPAESANDSLNGGTSRPDTSIPAEHDRGRTPEIDAPRFVRKRDHDASGMEDESPIKKKSKKDRTMRHHKAREVDTRPAIDNLRQGKLHRIDKAGAKPKPFTHRPSTSGDELTNKTLKSIEQTRARLSSPAASSAAGHSSPSPARPKKLTKLREKQAASEGHAGSKKKTMRDTEPSDQAQVSTAHHILQGEAVATASPQRRHRSSRSERSKKLKKRKRSNDVSRSSRSDQANKPSKNAKLDSKHERLENKINERDRQAAAMFLKAWAIVHGDG